MSDSETESKRVKLDVHKKPVVCIICHSTNNEKLSKVKDENSWITLYDAAIIRKFSSVISLSRDNTDWSTIFYHRSCPPFTLKKSLNSLAESNLLIMSSSDDASVANEERGNRTSLRKKTEGTGKPECSKVLEKKVYILR